MAGPHFSRNDLEFGIIDRPDHPDFDAVYKVYQKCFTLPSEQESKENFLSILASNGEPGLPGKEMWVYAKDKRTGEIVGASNFDVFKSQADPAVDGTVHAIYMLVAPEHRQRGLFDILIEEREKAACAYVQSLTPGRNSVPELVTFAEQNNALLETPNQYIDDTKAAIDQNLRRDIFEGAGFRTLQFRYVQPPLQPGGETCDYLDLVAKVPPGMTSVPSGIIQEHLQNFFTLSFPEGTTLSSPGLEGMKGDLDAIPHVALAEPGKFTALRPHMDLAKMEALPEEQRDTLIGELRPDLTQQFYGAGVTIAGAMESMRKVAMQRALATVSPKKPAPPSAAAGPHAAAILERRQNTGPRQPGA